MKKKIQLIPSGIPLVDTSWGGFYRGGTYLVVGSQKSGRTLLGLQFAMECARQKEVCLYFTSRRPKDLMIQATSIDFDLQNYMNQNLIIVVRVAPPTDFYEAGNPDDYLIEYLNDIVTVVDQYSPGKIIFDELTPFIGFNNLTLLENTFVDTIEKIEEKAITSLFILGEPATQSAQDILDVLVRNSTATVYLQKKSFEDSRKQGGRIIITPNVGHTEGQFTANYFIEPYKGISIEQKPAYSSTYSELKNIQKDTKYKSISNFELPEQGFTFSNIYDLSDFKLLMNNQIALFKSTGQAFILMSLRLDPAAEKQGLLTINQLQNAVRLSTDKKDKICVIGHTVIVLITKEDQKIMNSMIAKIKSNLPSSDPDYLKSISQFISVLSLKVDETIENADNLFQELLIDNQHAQDKYGIQ